MLYTCLTGVCFSISEYCDDQRQFVEANQLDTTTALTGKVHPSQNVNRLAVNSF